MPEPASSLVELLRQGCFVGVIVLVYWLTAQWCMERLRGKRSLGRFGRLFSHRITGAALLLLSITGLVCMAYGFFVEPRRLTVTRYTIHTPKIPDGSLVRIVHLADLHVRKHGPRERRLPELVRSLEPDLILHTGDFFSGTPESDRVVEQLLKSWDVPQYACPGNLDDLGDFDGTMRRANVAVPLRDGVIAEVKGAKLHILAASSWGGSNAPDTYDDLAQDTFNIVLCHRPSGFPSTWGTQIDLMLAGHIHGGQVRLPFYGALVTLDRYGKRWEYGLYEEQGVKLIVSRGIGCEPHVPEVRFLCPPEVVVIELVGFGVTPAHGG